MSCLSSSDSWEHISFVGIFGSSAAVNRICGKNRQFCRFGYFRKFLKKSLVMVVGPYDYNISVIISINVLQNKFSILCSRFNYYWKFIVEFKICQQILSPLPNGTVTKSILGFSVTWSSVKFYTSWIRK